MQLSRKTRQQVLRKVCGVINNDDAIDPRHYFSNKRKSKSKFRKVFQLCRQVLETLHFVLASGDDERLDGLSVVDVVPAPDARRLLVLLSLSREEAECGSSIDARMACLQSHVPRLRGEIAQSINRRKTPQLVFEITTQ